MLLYVSVLAVNGETFRHCCSVLHNQRDTAPGILSLYWNYDYFHLKNVSVYLSSDVIRDPSYYPRVL